MHSFETKTHYTYPAVNHVVKNIAVQTSYILLTLNKDGGETQVQNYTKHNSVHKTHKFYHECIDITIMTE